MSEGGEPRPSGPSRRTVLAGGGLLAALAASAAVGVRALGAEHRALPAPTATAAAPIAPVSAAPVPTAPPLPPPPPLGAPVPGVALGPRGGWALQSLLLLPGTGEWFTTQAKRGTSGLLDPAGLDVGDIVVSRLAADGRFLDAMVLPDAGHGMGLIVRLEGGVRVVYSCWFAPDASGRLYDVVRIPYAPGVAARTAAAPVVAGLGYPLDPCADPTTGAVTVRHQGGGGPEYTRHTWSDFAAGDLSRPTGAAPTTDRPPTHQGFATVGDRFFFYTGASSDTVGGDPALITEWSWTTGAVVGAPIDASALLRQADGGYPGGRMEPEGATVVVDPSGAAFLVVGFTTGGGPDATAPRTYPTFRYPVPAA
ncbi:hypothetical protein [Amnibacterium soli]